MISMKIADILRRRTTGFAFEFFPPKTDIARQNFVATLAALKRHDPLYVTMTYGAGGKTREATREAVEILLKSGMADVVPHLTCVGAKKSEVRVLLDDYKARGIENIMALRGDPPDGVAGFDFKAQELAYGVDLVRFIKQHYDFCLGVAVYPEGHVETAGLDADLEFTKGKIDAGADFAVTQMFFDNRYYYSFLERAKRRGITIPIIPGIMPLTDVAKIKKMIAVCRTTVPEAIAQKMEARRDDPQEMSRIGIDYTIAQCRDLIKNGATRIHFFTLNQPETITRIVEALR